jgi:hypothetical protein
MGESSKLQKAQRVRLWPTDKAPSKYSQWRCSFPKPSPTVHSSGNSPGSCWESCSQCHLGMPTKSWGGAGIDKITEDWKLHQGKSCTYFAQHWVSSTQHRFLYFVVLINQGRPNSTFFRKKKKEQNPQFQEVNIMKLYLSLLLQLWCGSFNRAWGVGMNDFPFIIQGSGLLLPSCGLIVPYLLADRTIEHVCIEDLTGSLTRGGLTLFPSTIH